MLSQLETTGSDNGSYLDGNDPGSRSDNDHTGSGSSDPADGKLFESIPDQDREKVFGIIEKTFFSGFMQRSTSFADKLTPDHFTQVINHADARDIRDREDFALQKSFNYRVLVTGLVFMAGLIWLLHGDKELLLSIFTSAAIFVGGYGFGQTKK